MSLMPSTQVGSNKTKIGGQALKRLLVPVHPPRLTKDLSSEELGENISFFLVQKGSERKKAT
jgi:hypothetical protein